MGALVSDFPFLYCRRPRRAWQPPALRRASRHHRYRGRRPLVGADASRYWAGRRLTRWLVGSMGERAGWLRLRGGGW